MTAKILDGKLVAKSIENDLSNDDQLARPARLSVILVGENVASATYVRNKMRACSRVGIECDLNHLPESANIDELLQIIERCNNDHLIDGILLQLPLPSHLDSDRLIDLIDPTKDVDGLTSLNAGKLARGDKTGFIPPTALGIWHLLKKSDIDIQGKHIVVVGRSNIVGRPLSILLSQKNFGGQATVTLAHSASSHLERLCQSADLLIAAIGRPNFFGKEHLKKNGIVIDVGIHRSDKGLIGDVSADAAAQICSARTPVPGGVGPLTVISLICNVLAALKRKTRA